MPLLRLSTQSVVVKGCLFAALLHLLLICVSTATSRRAQDSDDGNNLTQKLVREGRREERSKHHMPWKTPVMHTFFEPIPGGGAGATDQGHMNLLDVWGRSWESKGWKTKIMKVTDAELHPDFSKMQKILDELGINEYDKRCFYRWLAMSANGGGWMSDYDTFPLNFDAEVGAKISKYGIFTSFDSHVPSLISAAQHEWEKLLQLMIGELESRTKEDGFTSDMLILYDIKQKLGKKVGRFAKVGSLVAPGLSHAYVSVDDTGRVVNCDSMKDNLVIHCSHASTDEAYQKGLFPIAGLETYKEAMERRSEAALIFLDDFEAQCKPNI